MRIGIAITMGGTIRMVRMMCRNLLPPTAKREIAYARNTPSTRAMNDATAADEERVAERLPDGERLIRRAAGQLLPERAEREDLPVVVEGEIVGVPVGRPRHPLPRVLERGREHPVEREDDEEGPREQDGVPHPDPPVAPKPAPPRRHHRPPASVIAVTRGSVFAIPFSLTPAPLRCPRPPAGRTRAGARAARSRRR